MAPDYVRLQQAFAAAHTADIDTMLVEYIPGADDRLCSYYTYLDAKHNPQFHYTKRILRRFPAGMGSACYHVTDWIPELPDLALPLLRKAGLRGLANIEFKYDDRDGRYKLIECNARFTASNCLVAASGFDLATFVYNRIVGRPEPSMGDYRRGLRLWDPLRDFWAYRQLSSEGRLTFPQWVSSVMHPQTFPFFSWSDPLPAVARLAKPPKRALRKWLRRATVFKN
jgi:predicted ATP-grasp superfamily ATP-dependent carboligase